MMFAGSLRIWVPGAGIDTDIVGQDPTLSVGTPKFRYILVTFWLHLVYRNGGAR